MPQKVKESDIQQAILEWLAYKRIFHYRNNTGAFPFEYNGKKRYVRFSKKGSPDIYCIVSCRKIGIIIGIEVKADTGKQSQDQCEFQREFEAAGGYYCIARSIEDVENYIEYALKKTVQNVQELNGN